MNFYSEDIIYGFIDDPGFENIIDLFYQNIYRLFCKYSEYVISSDYILFLLKDHKNKIAFRCIDTYFNIENCPSILIYHMFCNEKTNEIVYYVLMICTKNKFKKYGYASMLLDDFIQHIKDKHGDDTTKNIKIILSSVESAVTFYETYGFRWTRESLLEHPTLTHYEKYEEGKEYFILELIV
jgi:ribosomal protein S18 acetylase RimI-like enzyme